MWQNRTLYSEPDSTKVKLWRETATKEAVYGELAGYTLDTLLAISISNSRCQFVDQLTTLGAYLKHYLLNSWKCLCCVFVRKWCALCISKEPSTQKRCCVQPICWPIYPSQKGILFLVTQNINLRNQTTILAEPIRIQKNQNLDQWFGDKT